MEMDSHYVNFLNNEFAGIGEIKKDFELYKIEQDLQPSLGEGEDLNSRQVNKDSAPPLPERNGEDLSAQGNDVRPESPTREKNQPQNEVCP